jgi:hypothetical protein
MISSTIALCDTAAVSPRDECAVLGVINILCLAASPTFAIIALVIGVFGGDPRAALCSAVHGGSPLSGMVPMYLLMSAFHSVPWLKLIASRIGRSAIDARPEHQRSPLRP